MSYAVLRVQSGTEFDTRERLLDYGVDARCPKVMITVKNRKSTSHHDRFSLVSVPMFPGYLFVEKSSMDIPSKAKVRASYLMMEDTILFVTDAQFDVVTQTEQELEDTRMSNNLFVVPLSPTPRIMPIHSFRELVLHSPSHV